MNDTAQQFLEALGYDRAASFRSSDDLVADRNHGFLFRKAREHCGLAGAYMLQGANRSSTLGDIPAVYVCGVDSEDEARIVHRRVWNQDLVPFLFVVSPAAIRLYPGFNYKRVPEGELESADTGAIAILRDLNEVGTKLQAFTPEGIDTGQLWREWGSRMRADRRVDWQLLSNLQQLEHSLVSGGLTDVKLAHSVIGKFVYLRYLLDRQILSPRKLESWKLTEEATLGRGLEIDEFLSLLTRLDEWLNGSVFPLDAVQIREVGQTRLRQVASIFRGDSASGQLAFDFSDYDFSFIPIETLSVIYEQFLHAPTGLTGTSKGREAGAYYTPIPVVNYMLDRLHDLRPLCPGMSVLDPACGSGVFLVQCYRRLIEDQIRLNNAVPRATELRQILTESIFGIDADSDACQIAELGLNLTLLDYVNPPDLEASQVRRFKLPSLRDTNIVHGDAFSESESVTALTSRRFDWVVGNPPWNRLRLQGKDKESPAGKWAAKNAKERPIGGNQIAELFAWRSLDALGSSAAAALLLPAMTLFKHDAGKFRRRFFADANIHAVSNFSNLVTALFRGRSTVPAIAVFFSQKNEQQPAPESIEVYSPFTANQPALAESRVLRQQKEVWSITVDSSEIRNLRYATALSGESVPWKIMSWGSYLDSKLLSRVSHGHDTIGDFEKQGRLKVAQGFQLRTADSKDKITQREELVGALTYDPDKTKRARHLFRLPEDVLQVIPRSQCYVRNRGGYATPLDVCKPPHVMVPLSRSFAVYEDRFMAVPRRQMGISGSSNDKDLLKALALYLNSDFALYFQFFHSAESGVQKTIYETKDLRALPVPFPVSEAGDFAEWIELYKAIEAEIGNERNDFDTPDLLQRLNELTSRSLKLDSRAQTIVSDLVNVRMSMTRGKVTPATVAKPTQADVHAYLANFRAELDDFFEGGSGRHAVVAHLSGEIAAIQVKLVQGATGAQPIRVTNEGTELANEYARALQLLQKVNPQWFYFERNLRMYSGSYTYVFKPLRLLHWTRSQAMLDAGELVGDMIAAGSKKQANA